MQIDHSRLFLTLHLTSSASNGKYIVWQVKNRDSKNRDRSLLTLHWKLFHRLSKSLSICSVTIYSILYIIFANSLNNITRNVYNLIHIYHEYFIKKGVLLLRLCSWLLEFETSKEAKRGREKEVGSGGGGGFPIHNLRAKPLLSWIFKNCIEYHFGMLGCYFRVKQYIIPLRCLLPSVSVRWKYFRSVSLDSILFSPDINHALEPQFSNKFYL